MARAIFEPALVAVRQVAGGIVGARSESDCGKPAPRLFDGEALGMRVVAKTEHAENGEAGGDHQVVVLRDQQIFEHGHAG